MKCVSIVAIQMAVCQTRSVGALLERRPGRGPHVAHSGTPPVVELVAGLVDIGAHVEVPGVGGRQPVPDFGSGFCSRAKFWPERIF